MSKFLKQLGKREILTPHLDRWFEKYQPEVDPIPLSIQIAKPKDSYFHPSSHCVGCARTIYRAFDPEFEGVPDGRVWNNKVAINGHLWHALLEHVVVNELKFCDTYELTLMAARVEGGRTVQVANAPFALSGSWIAQGSLDLPWVLVPGQDEPMVVDIKTMNPSSFAQQRPAPYLWNKYVAQMQVYLDWVQLDRGMLLCVQAGWPFDFKEIMIERDPDAVAYIYQKWDSIAEAVASGIPPAHSCATPSECASLEWYGQETISV